MGQCEIMSFKGEFNKKQTNELNLDHIVLKDLTKGQNGLYFFDSDRGCLYKVSSMYKEKWIEKTEKFLNVRLGKVGIINNQRQKSTSCLKKFLNKVTFKCGQGILSSLSSIIPRIFSVIETVKNISNSSHLMPMLLDISSLLLQAMSPTYSNWSPTYLLGHLMRFYSLYIRGKSLVLGQSTTEAFTLATVSMFLPAPLLEIIKRMNLFTGKKILDTPSSILDCITGIVEFFSWCLDQIPYVPPCVRKFIESITKFSERSTLIKDMLEKTMQYNKCKSVMLEEEWRASVRSLDTKIKECEDVLNYFKTSQVNQARYKDFLRLVKSLEAYEKCSRKEPVAIVFEGPPGTRKSFIMSNLTERLGKSVYTHVVKAMADGKDFYDTYNNEDIFLMDDVGQQGVSQWRTIINMVSTVKLPLDCAAVDLKDTKYFNSELVMCTTNNFSNLTGLTKSDCIADIKALWRRCNVFNFDDVAIKNGQLTGEVVYKRFCPYKNAYVEQFPFDSSIPTRMLVNNKNKLIAWMHIIVKRLMEFFENNYNSNQLTDNDSEVIGRYEAEFEEADFADVRESNPQGQGFFSRVVGACLKQYAIIAVDFLRFLAVAGVSVLVAEIFKYINSSRTTEIAVRPNRDSVEEEEGYKVGWPQLLSTIAAALIVNLLMGEILHLYFNNIDDVLAESRISEERELINIWKKVSGQSLENLGTLVETVGKRMAVVEILHMDKEQVTGQVCQALISGHFVLGPQHAFQGRQKGILNAYKDWQHYSCNSAVLNNTPYEIVYENMDADLVIAKLPTYMLTPFKNCKDYFRVIGKTEVSRTPAIATAGGVFKANRNFNLEKRVLQYTTYRNHTVEVGKYIEYEGFSSPGLSGSLIVDPIEGIVGMHVAGDEKTGNAIIFNVDLRKKINKILSGDNLIVEVESVDTLLEDFSGNKYNTKLYQNVPSKTSLVPTPLVGVFPMTKFPANLSVKGVKTVEVMAEKSFLKIPVIPEQELDFARSIFNIMIPEFKDITDEEVVRGNNILAPLNKKSVNGFGLEKDKEFYIDFENGIMRENIKKEMDELEMRVKGKEIAMEDVLFYETLKDELRLEAKVEKPRTFRICRLPIILWQKKIFGDLFQQVMTTSDFNQVSLGTNPYKDWDKFYNEMTKMEIVFDIDIATFDGKQAAQMQDLCNSVILSKYRGEHKEMAEFLLEMIVRSWLLVRNKLMTTTHSLPSGIWLTGLLNSFYNRGYSACSFSREMIRDNKKPLVVDFFKLLDRVCGDDKLCGAPKGLEKYFNAKTVGSFFNSIGMKATTGTKGEIEHEGQDISEVSFLKRKFKYHPELRKVMGPLDKETLVNSVQWFDIGKDLDIVLDGKLRSFQREMYLHPDGDLYIEKVKEKCKEEKIPFPLLTRDYIKHLFLEEPDEAYRLYIEENNKNYFY